MNTDNFFTFNW